MSASTWHQLVAVLRDVAPVPPLRVEPEHRLVEDIGLDSLALARAIVALEIALDLELPKDRLAELRHATAGQLAVLLDETAAA